MAHTQDELEKKSLEELKEIAAGVEAAKVPDYESLEKDDLVKLLCTALEITPASDAAQADTAAEAKAAADAKAAAAKSGEKAKIKAQIHALKAKRAAAIEAHDAKQLKWTRLNIKRLKQKMRQVTA